MRRYSFVAGSAAFSIASIGQTACAQQLPRKLRYGIAPAEDAALASCALKKGFFEKAGLDVELIMFPSGGAITLGLLGGSLDLGVTNMGALAAAHVAGIPLSLVACGSLYSSASPSAHLVVLKKGPLRSAKDLAGKTVAVSSLHEFAHCPVLQWLDRNGVDSKTVNFVQMPLGTAVTALQASHIDAIDLVEPLFTRWKAELTDLGTPLSAVADGRPVEIFGTVATKNFIEANSVVVRAAADALRMAARWANDPRNSREAAVTIADFTKVDSASVSAYPRLHFGERLDPALIQPSIDMMAKYAFLPRAFPAGDLFANLPG